MNEFKELSSIEKNIYKSLLVSKKLKKDLMLEMNLPKTTVNRALQNLISKNLIEEIGFDSSTGGRPPIVYGPSSNNFFVIGIDISRSYSEVIIVDSSLNIKFKNRFEMTIKLDPKSTVTKISKIIFDAIYNLSIDKNKIIGISLGVVEPIDLKSGTFGSLSNFLNKQWSELNIKALFEEYFSLPIFIDRGTNMAALGEFFINQDTNLKKIIYLNLGLGIRYGLVNNGEIMDSHHKIYDALGHMTINLNGSKCICGKNGCLELYGTISAIESNYNLNNKSNKINIDSIIKNALLGEEKALKAIDDALYALSIGINNFSNILNPDKVIINGPLIQKNPYIFEKLIENIKSFNNNDSSIESIYSKTSYFKESIISMGAAITLILKHID